MDKINKIVEVLLNEDKIKEVLSDEKFQSLLSKIEMEQVVNKIIARNINYF